MDLSRADTNTEARSRPFEVHGSAGAVVRGAAEVGLESSGVVCAHPSSGALASTVPVRVDLVLGGGERKRIFNISCPDLSKLLVII